MRTTLNLDEDVVMAAKEKARREGRSTGAVLSELARQALNGRVEQDVAKKGARSRHGFRPLPHRGEAISNDLIDRLREDQPE